MKTVQRGFTLIELIVVILILGILAATALPKFVDLSADARNASAQGVAGALSSGYAVNYGAKLAGNAGATSVNTATECTAAKMQNFVSGVTLVDKADLAAATATTPENNSFAVLASPAGVCTAATVAAGTVVNCSIAALGGTAAANVSVICTKS